MKKVIGLIPLYDDEKESYWMLPGYMKVLEECNALPIILPLTNNKEELDQCLSMCDGLLFTGGHDVNPELYHEKPLNTCGKPCNTRDAMEEYLFQQAYRQDKPIFGICRGIQLINVLLGGTLYQDLPTQYNSNTEHHMSPPYDEPIHTVIIKKDSILEHILQTREYKVNSYHHQAIKDLAPNLEVLAYSEDGLVEAIRVPNKKFILAVQWHPEFAYKKDKASLRLIQAFVDAL